MERRVALRMVVLRMTIRVRFLIFCLLQPLFVSLTLLSAPMCTASEDPASWDPQHTWVFSVGVLQWAEKSMATFTPKHRRDAALMETLATNGIPRDHMVYIQDKAATLKTIRDKFAKLLAQTKPGDTLIVYYCGHGWTNEGVGYYGNYDAGDDWATCWSTRTISSDLSAFKGSTALITVDCCHSGSIIKALKASKPKFNWGVLTASVETEESTGNWTFSQALLDCFNGHKYADANGDGIVTFAELAAYIKDEMKFFEHQDSAMAQSAGFNPSYKMGTVTFADEAIPERAEAKYEKDWWPVKILATKGTEAKIHWITIGWDAPEDDQWIALSQIRKIKGANASAAAPPAASTTGSGTSDLAVGSEIQVKYKEDWYPAKITKVSDGKYFIHYDAYDNSWDEWIGKDRIK